LIVPFVAEPLEAWLLPLLHAASPSAVMPTIAATATARSALFDRNGKCIVILFGCGYDVVSEWEPGSVQSRRSQKVERHCIPDTSRGSRARTPLFLLHERAHPAVEHDANPGES
jgi:hypothetical protein